MVTAQEAFAPKLAWGLRKYKWPIVVVTIAFTVATAFLGHSGSSGYEAQALVVVAQTPLSQSQLPRLATAVFNSGEVAAGVINLEHLDVAPDKLIPGQISVVPFNDTVLFQVTARASRARDAARLANDAATVFVDQLNKPGRGVGTFQVQEKAQVPSKPSSSPRSTAVLLLVGLIGGLAVALFGLMALLAVRRPIVSAAAATQLLETEALGTLVIPRRGTPSVERVGGLSRVARQLRPDHDRANSVAFVPCGDASLSDTVGRLVAASTRAQYVPYDQYRPPQIRKAATSHSSSGAEEREPSPVLSNVTPAVGLLGASNLTVIGGVEDPRRTDMPQAVLDADARVLVVPIGAAESTVRDTAQQFGAQELNAVVCVDRRRLRR